MITLDGANEHCAKVIVARTLGRILGSRARRCLVRAMTTTGIGVSLLVLSSALPTTTGASAASGPSISAVYVSGSLSSPTVTVTGQGFGTESALGAAQDPAAYFPPGASVCSGNLGNDYGANLYLQDTSANWNAGEGGTPTANGDQIGLVISSYSDTKIVFTLGSCYSFYRLSAGDAYTMNVLGASYSGTVEYASPPTATISSPANGQGEHQLQRRCPAHGSDLLAGKRTKLPPRPVDTDRLLLRRQHLRPRDLQLHRLQRLDVARHARHLERRQLHLHGDGDEPRRPGRHGEHQLQRRVQLQRVPGPASQPASSERRPGWAHLPDQVAADQRCRPVHQCAERGELGQLPVHFVLLSRLHEQRPDSQHHRWHEPALRRHRQPICLQLGHPECPRLLPVQPHPQLGPGIRSELQLELRTASLMS
jgi:hypothetical protein